MPHDVVASGVSIGEAISQQGARRSCLKANLGNAAYVIVKPESKHVVRHETETAVLSLGFDTIEEVSRSRANYEQA